MSDFYLEEPRAGYVALHGELTVERAAELKTLLLEQLQKPGSLELDLLNVTRIDTAGVQLMLMLQREAQAINKDLTFQGFSLAVEETLELLGVESKFVPAAVLWS